MKHMFPISVVSIDGQQVTLSQGGNALAVGTTYKLYQQGEIIKDPQTGEAIGHSESYCCSVRVDRVASNLSYGTLEDVHMDLTKALPGSLLVKEVGVKIDAKNKSVVTNVEQETPKKHIKKVDHRASDKQPAPMVSATQQTSHAIDW
jgi:hypothetical protein